MPPPASCSRDERIVDRFEPVPEPPLKSMASVFARSMIDVHGVLDGVDEARARLLRRAVGLDTPRLNQTGELKHTFWCSSR